MKKAIVLLAMGFTLTYCNPSQQADQTTTTDTTRTGGTDATTPGTNPSGGGSTDTTSHPDTTNRPGLMH